MQIYFGMDRAREPEIYKTDSMAEPHLPGTECTALYRAERVWHTGRSRNATCIRPGTSIACRGAISKTSPCVRCVFYLDPRQSKFASPRKSRVIHSRTLYLDS